MTKEQVIALMESSTSEESWNANSRRVKVACGGYPDFWYDTIILSGMAKRVLEAAGSSADMTVMTHTRKPIAISGRPTSMPPLTEGQHIIGVYYEGAAGEKEVRCNSLDDMQRLYDYYLQGLALTLRWFVASSSKLIEAAPAG